MLDGEQRRRIEPRFQTMVAGNKLLDVFGGLRVKIDDQEIDRFHDFGEQPPSWCGARAVVADVERFSLLGVIDIDLLVLTESDDAVLPD